MSLTLLQVAAGGAVGASLRYLVNVSALRLLGPGFPWGTVVVNVVGSFVMGVLVVVMFKRGGMAAAPFLMTGVLGGFTTFSAFTLDAVSLAERGESLLAFHYVMGSVAASLLAILGGMYIARAVL